MPLAESITLLTSPDTTGDCQLIAASETAGPNNHFASRSEIPLNVQLFYHYSFTEVNLLFPEG
jgi:hypothetical protein